MVWLAGLLGLVAIGGVALADIFSDDDLTEDAEDEGPADAEPDRAPETANAESLLPLDTGSTGEENVDESRDLQPLPDDGPQGLTLTGGPEIDFLSGGAGEDDIAGGSGQDQINGYGGDDRIAGGPGGDRLTGADGDDRLAGGTGADVLHGGYGADDLRGEAGDDQLFGHAGADRLAGGAGGDRMEGGLGDDTLLGGAGDDALHGAESDDVLEGGAGADTLFGGWGDDTLSGLEPRDGGTTPGDTETDPARPGPEGHPASDFLNGGSGADTILAGAGDVVTAGEAGDDIVLGGWIAEGAAAELMDYDPAEDQLMLVWDTKADPAPEIEVTADPEIPGMSHIVVNGTELARVHGGAAVAPGDIRLVDYADAPDLAPARG